MKLLICVDCDSNPLSSEHVVAAYRVVDWPCVPREGESVYPFVEVGVDSEVQGVYHRFDRGYVSLLLAPFPSKRLEEYIAAEADHWLVSTRANRVSEADVVKQLFST